jgi:hypothetical protein
MAEKLPNEQFRLLVKATRDLEFKREIYQEQVQREIDWKSYNLSLIKNVKDTLVFIRDMTNTAYSPKVRSNATNPKLLAKAVLLSEFYIAPKDKLKDGLKYWDLSLE